MTRGATYVIAEIGSCHDGDIAQAVKLIREAKVAGANAAKLQYWSDSDALADRRKVPEYYREIYRKYAVPKHWLPVLHDVARAADIDFMCTVYLPQDVEAVAPYVRHFKVASFEAQSGDLVKAHLPFMGKADGRLVFVSRGMGASHLTWRRFEQARFLYCVSAYPAPLESLRLDNIRAGGYFGFSDHSAPKYTMTGGLAVAAGAHVIEAHIRDTFTHESNPDAPHAMFPDKFEEYVNFIRFAEECVAGELGMHESEAPMAQYRVVN